jgi:Response regulator containing CheY-like receiver domain and AraC-type DNA-binding domain
MFKVLIIDDEPIIRKGLKNIINWKSYGCEVTGEASDGLEGCELIKRHLPEIIITDIRMPEVDGLSMVQEIKDIVPDSKIIILTGYRDFDYVHEALKLGAFDFLLKPSRIEELTAVISRAVKELRFQKERKEEFDKLNKLFEQNIPILREKLLYDVIYDINTNEAEINEKMELFNMKVDKFVLLIVQNDSDDSENREISQYDRHLYQFGIINTFEEVFSDGFKVLSIPLNNEGIAFILMSLDGCHVPPESIDKKCIYLQDIIRNCFGFTVTIAISSEGNGPMQMPAKLKECREALEHKFYMGDGSVIFYKDVGMFFRYDDHTMLEKLQKSLLEGVKSGNEEAVRNRLTDIFNYVKGLDNCCRDYVRNFYWNTISSVNSIRLSIQTADGDRKMIDRQLTGVYGLMEKCQSVDELDSMLESAALSVVQKVNLYNNKNMKLILRKAVEYLQQHYQEQVTLNEVAEEVFVSTYYISRLFKKETGINFVDYLNEIRIEKAKILLKDVRFKTYEVAESVGIPDAHYFSRLFKKHVGITPSEFREM